MLFQPGPQALRFRAPTVGFDTAPQVRTLSPNSDRTAGGTSVTITGLNFRKSSSGASPIVRFGGTPSTSVVVVDQFTITCVTPAVSAAGLVDVAVQCDSQIGLLTNSFTFYSGTLSAITPGYGPLSGGTVVTLTGYNFVTGSTILFGSQPATGVTFLDDRNMTAIAPANSLGFVIVTIVEPGGAHVVLPHAFQYTLLTRGNDIRRSPGIVVRDVLGSAPNTCTFKIDGKSNTPQIGEEIQIVDSFDGNRLLFAGNIQTTVLSYEGEKTNLAWEATATDFVGLLNRRRPFGLYINMKANLIVNDLMAKYAPGFTTNHVQTNLAPISIAFDGTQDFSACLSAIAVAIGGGHWKIDYFQDLHFFHRLPPNISLPTAPQSPLRLGPGTAPTISEGSQVTPERYYGPGVYLFRVAFVYNNGVESVMGPCSNCALLQGNKSIQFFGLPIGAAIGSLTCVKRRVYYYGYGPSSAPTSQLITSTNGWVKGFEVSDNTTVDLTDANGGSTTIGRGAAYYSAPLQISFPLVAPTVQTSLLAQSSFTPGHYGFKYTWVTAGVESLPSPMTSVFLSTGTHPASLSNIAVGPAGTTERKIYWTYLDNSPNTINPPSGIYYPLRRITDNVTTAVTSGIGQWDASVPAWTGATSPPTSGAAGPGALTGVQNLALAVVVDLGAGPGNLTLAQDYTYVYTYAATPDHLNETAPSPASPAKQTASGRLVILVPCAIDEAGINWVFCYRSAAGGGLPYKQISRSSGYPDFAPFPYTTRAQAAAIAAYPVPPGYPPQGYQNVCAGGVDDLADASRGQIAPPISLNVVKAIPVGAPLPFQPTVAPPTNASGPISITLPTSFTKRETYAPQAPLLNDGVLLSAYALGNYKFSVTNLYRDGTESLQCTETASISVFDPAIGFAYDPFSGTSFLHAFNIPIGPTINGVDVVARLIYGHFLGQTSTASQFNIPEGTSLWYIVPDNTTIDVAQFAQLTAGGPPPNTPATPALPVWPNPDGPSLEDQTPPEDITDASVNLLGSGSQQFSLTIDSTQLRNRITVVGGGTSLTKAAVVGDTTISLADTSMLSPTTGKVFAGNIALPYFAVTLAGLVYLSEPIPIALPSGQPITNYLQLDDLASQAAIGKVELDTNGRPTDGIHEYVINDSSLVTPLQLYMRAHAELELFGWPVLTIKYSTRDPKSISGQMVHVDISSPPCKGDFLIQDVTIDQIHDESDDLAPRYTVTATSIKFELNDLLVQLISGALSGGGSSSLAGVVTAAVAAVPPTAAGILTQVTTITDGMVRTLLSIPRQVTPMAAAGKVIVPITCTIHWKNPLAFSGYSSSRNVSLRYSLIGGTGVGANDVSLPANVIPSSSPGGSERWWFIALSGSNNFVDPGSDGTCVGKALMIVSAGDVTGGDPTNSMVVAVTYMIIDGLGV